ncbi:ankyrin repeat and BTB/POZ domain-containing protein 1-like [Mytilus trossulus]|uniref:ankyrin repeat and BTB/POZ domain-containing protein 1-like n=1 Tax=Mytilus trossulus TaxID=6551 RepID=UPI00300638BF
MDLQDLFASCKRGDLQKVQYLVEQKEIELNVRDKWDSTPLYYVCLCGYEELVKYLLEKGAKCQANTFDGERCVYGALNNRIRNLLKSYNVISSKTMRRDQYEEFLRRLTENGSYKDIVFHVHGEEFPAHRCVLSARCDYFANLFRTRWKDRQEIVLSHHLITPSAFKSVLEYLYTGRLETHIDNVDDCQVLAKQCQLHNLQEQIYERFKKTLSFELTKPGVNVTTLVLEQPLDSKELQMELSRLADLALPAELCTQMHGELPFEPEYQSVYPDICFTVEGHKFLGHKAFFCERSDYFKALLNNHFGENDTESTIPVVRLCEVNSDIFTKVLYYIYQDSCELSEETVYDVLCCADLYLLPGLKRHCANYIGKHLNTANVVQVTRTAKLFSLPRLEDQCAEFIANNIEKILEQEDFAELVKQDAAEVKGRQETDTIDIIDNIRFHLTFSIQTYGEMEEANEKLRLIDDLLEELELEG